MSSLSPRIIPLHTLYHSELISSCKIKIYMNLAIPATHIMDEMLFINENSQIRVVNEVYKLHILHGFYKGVPDDSKAQALNVQLEKSIS
ncbi:hypothetical protein Tco_0999326, partial [Tanacetum coccineum]